MQAEKTIRKLLKRYPTVCINVYKNGNRINRLWFGKDTVPKKVLIAEVVAVTPWYNGDGVCIDVEV